MKAVALLLRAGLTVVFVWAAVAKIAGPRAFQDAISSYHLLPPIATAIVAVWLPWLELTLAVCLWVPRVSRTATALVALLCASFLAALVQAWIRGIDITCGCFGDASVVSGAGYLPYLARDIALVLAGCVLFRFQSKAAPDESGAAISNP